MNAHARLLLLLEIEIQARFALRASRDLKRAVRRGERTETFWYAVQAFLVASANVSKLLWGSQGSKIDRRELRELLGVEDTSPLRSRSLRNHFEHFDERIESWMLETRGELSSVDLHVGSADETVPDELLRGFDPKSETFLYGAERYELEPLIHSMRALHAAIRLALPPVGHLVGTASSGSEEKTAQEPDADERT